MTHSSRRATPYHQPDIVTVLITSSFILLLNVVGFVLDKLIYCGLLGQILVGVSWGAPATAWLPEAFQTAVTQLGYLGLVLLIFEGGLSTNLEILRTNLWLCLVVAAIGVCVPIALSFLLMVFGSAAALQAFAAGCALCSTSLGTTFSVLKTTKLASSVTAATIVRPVGVSIAFAVVVLLICRWVVKPLLRQLQHVATPSLLARLSPAAVGFVWQTTLLIGLVTGASYAGTSNLFAAYLAGVCITWLDTTRKQPDVYRSPSDAQGDSVQSMEKPEHSRTSWISTSSNNNKIARMPSFDQAEQGVNSAAQHHRPPPSEQPEPASKPVPETNDPLQALSAMTGQMVYGRYYSGPVHHILIPFFFASVGFAIPLTHMFHSAVVWRGMVYTALMCIGKLVCGLAVLVTDLRRRSRPTDSTACVLLGFAMVARGEIGFLVSAIAQANGIFTRSTTGAEHPDLFLIVTWAIVLCTAIGPVAVGVLVKTRLRKIRRKKQSDGVVSGRAGDEWFESSG